MPKSSSQLVYVAYNENFSVHRCFSADITILSMQVQMFLLIFRRKNHFLQSLVLIGMVGL
jgi:hypothetical protein